MKLINGLTMEIQAAHNPARSSVELRFAATAEEDARIVHLSRDEARRLAAFILFQAAQLDHPEVSLSSPHAQFERRSA